MPVDLQIIVDDLFDALLADLHSTTTHIATRQQRSENSCSPPPPPLPPPPTQDVLDGLNNHNEVDEPLYEVQQVRPVHSTTITVSKNRYPNPGAANNGIANNGTANGGSGGGLSNNLNELDTLLQDLSSAQFMAEVEQRRNTAGTAQSPGGHRSVDHLLNELEDTLPSHSQQGAGHYEQVNMRPHGGPAAASSATRELDDLMASLSDFKMSGNAKQNIEPPYAQPNKLKANNAMPANEAPIQPSVAKSAQSASGENLEAMLGTLSDDLHKQGISTVPKGHCAACTKPIVGQVITALAKMWHPEHFTCHHCGEMLGTQNFFERDSHPYCERDYHTLFSPKCALCSGPILDKCVTALDKTWHPEHFVCAHCQKPFGEDGFHEKDGKAFCRTDFFEMFAPKCGGCQRPIMDNYISALSKQWHPECFVCRECHMPFGSTSFYDHDGFPYCETHYHAKRGSLCASCQKPITGRCITAMYKKFHPEHFVCAFCLQQLNKGTFKEQNEKPYCHPCFVKLFG